MRNEDYINTLMRVNKKIYIDTASLMDVEGLELFIVKVEKTLLTNSRKITVPRSVCLELTRHLGSNYTGKREKALKVMELLNEHKDLFNLENDNLDDSEILKAFADSEILAELTIKKMDCGQLLITNDRNLSKDAFDLNSLASCRGYQIMVCFINRFGELHKCECIKKANLQVKENDPKKTDTFENESSTERLAVTIQSKISDERRTSSLYSMCGVTLVALILGYVTGKYSNSVF